jgi:predicted metal-dependent hydrolase
LRAQSALEVVRRVALSDGVLDYTLRRSTRARHLRVTVHPLRGVVVTIPMRGTIRAVDDFLRERETWLRRHLRSQEQQRERSAAQRPFGPDGHVLFRGALHRVRLEAAERGTRRSRVIRVATDDLDEIVLLLAATDRRATARVLEDWLRDEAAATVNAAIARHAPHLRVAPAAVSFRDPRTRWGSATRTGRLSFSWRLILAPPQALESVVVHELAHLRVFGHGPAFWAIVASRMPDHRTWRTWLRDHSLELHAALDEPAEADEVEDGAPVGQLAFTDLLAI